jgi:multicomponent Na+:H+ antiporter subunit G
MHAGGVGDTQGLLLVVLAVAVSAGSIMDAAKLLLLVVFMWNTSPVSSHFLSQIEYYTNPKLFDHMERL